MCPYPFIVSSHEQLYQTHNEVTTEQVQPEPGGSFAENVDSEKGTASSTPSEVYAPNNQNVVHSQATTENGANMCDDSTNENVILTPIILTPIQTTAPQTTNTVKQLILLQCYSGR